ncbi:MAG: hypothetical protein Q8O99_00715 [bacterium]|nr:hypothetical protein [bacterium]
MDASLVGNSAAMRNNNPGNIKLPSRSGTTKKVLDELNINYEEGSRATDGGYFCKFANVGDGLAAMLAVFSSNRNNTLEYFFGKYSNNSYEQEQMLPTGATKDTYLKQLTDVQLIELLQRMRKREDGDMYALIQEHGESSLVG